MRLNVLEASGADWRIGWQSAEPRSRGVEEFQVARTASHCAACSGGTQPSYRNFTSTPFFPRAILLLEVPVQRNAAAAGSALGPLTRGLAKLGARILGRHTSLFYLFM